MSFNKETPILYFNPRSSSSWSQRRYLLWPAFLYRVVAPKFSDRKVNILEKAILGLFWIGNFTALEIGEQLDIGTDLAALIISQLTDENYLNAKGELTERGQKILDDEILNSQEVIAGYLFQDPWTGELWPRFQERLEYAEVKFNGEGYPEIMLGTTGKPNYQKIYMPLPIDGILNSQPTSKDILETVKKHNKALKYKRGSDDETEENWNFEQAPSDILETVKKHNKALKYKRGSDDETEENWNFEQAPSLKRISFIEEIPTPVWLTTFIYVPKTSSLSTSLSVCDPFGLNDSPWLLRRMNQHINKQRLNGLEKVISNLLNSQRQELKQDSNYADFIKQINEEASILIEGRLTIKILEWTQLFNSLLAMERIHLEAEALQNTKGLGDKLDDVLVKTQKVIETLLSTIRDTYSTDGCWKILSSKDREYNRSIFNQLAQKLGFNTPLPQTLTDVKQGKVKSAADYGQASLRPYLLANLLATRHHLNHPLKRVAQKIPDMLDKLDKLAGLRDQSCHFSGQQLTFSDVSQQIEVVYDFVAEMLELPRNY